MTIPYNVRAADGIAVITGDQLNTFVQTDRTAAQLRGFVGATGMTVVLQGITAPNDGGGGIFYWATGVYTDDGANVIVPPAAAGQGGWLRLDLTSASPGNYLFNPLDFLVVGNLVSLAGTIQTSHTWTGTQSFDSINLSGAPTSDAGLNPGDVFLNGGFVCVAP